MAKFLKIREPALEPLLRKIRFEKVLHHIVSNSVVVDIGCGHTPHLLNRLQRYIKTGIGFDPLVASKDRGKIKLLSKLIARKIPIKNNFANHVTLIAVLEHLENPDSILLESYRILKPGGSVIVTTPTPMNKPLLEFLSFRLGIVSTREIAEHKRYYWKKGLETAIKKAGFRKIRHEYFELFLNNFLVAYK